MFVMRFGHMPLENSYFITVIHPIVCWYMCTGGLHTKAVTILYNRAVPIQEFCSIRYPISDIFMVKSC